MTDWKVTATTIYCDAVNDEVTFIVSGDGTVVCTGYQRYGASGKRSGSMNRTCAGEGCRIMLEHRDRMVGEGTRTG